jgi:hypothetical protein
MSGENALNFRAEAMGGWGNYGKSLWINDMVLLPQGALLESCRALLGWTYEGVRPYVSLLGLRYTLLDIHRYELTCL